LQSEYEYKLLGYTPEDFPGWINYMPPMEDQPLLELAPEEAPGARPACVLPPALAAVSSSCPDASWQMPYVSLEVGSRYAGTQVGRWRERQPLPPLHIPVSFAPCVLVVL
jgi:hypothetical protein